MISIINKITQRVKCHVFGKHQWEYECHTVGIIIYRKCRMCDAILVSRSRSC